MLQLQQPAIAITNYTHACQHAIEDLISVFGSLQAGAPAPEQVYEQYFPTRVRMAPGNLGAFPIQRLIRAIAQKQGFNVTFLSWRPGQPPLANYVSWLVVNFAKKELVITFDFLKVADIIPLDVAAKYFHLPTNDSVRAKVLQEPAFMYTCEKVLGKILLHEMGHASLHLGYYNLAQNLGLNRVQMPPECETEAWVYSLTVWGALVGDHSYLARTSGIADTGYVVC